MAQDTGRFWDAPEPDLLPLYEAKLIHQFDHRWASYHSVGSLQAPKANKLSDAQKMNPHLRIKPRYWVTRSDTEEQLTTSAQRRWLLTWRGITNSENERTVISSVVPFAGTGGNHYVMALRHEPAVQMCVLAALNSFVLDYNARNKIGGSHINLTITSQLPILPPDTYDQSTPWQPDTILRDWIADRVLELSYTAWDLQTFARDLGYDGPPFRWDPERRFEIRCELDAAFFHLYEIERDDVDYIMSTFPIVQRKDEAAHGHYRTRDRILEIYDAMALGEWQSSLDPPVADPRAAHPAES